MKDCRCKVEDTAFEDGWDIIIHCGGGLFGWGGICEESGLMYCFTVG